MDDQRAAFFGDLEEPRRGELERLDALVREAAPALEPYVTSGMLAYGPFHYRYASGREGDTAVLALASRKQYISLYVQCETPTGYLAEQYADRLPKANIGKACVRFKRLSDVDEAALRDLLVEAGRLGPGAAATG